MTKDEETLVALVRRASDGERAAAEALVSRVSNGDRPGMRMLGT